MAVDRGAHVLPGHDGSDLLLRRDVLPTASLPQGVQGEGGVTIHLRSGEELSRPAGREIWIVRDYTNITKKSIIHFHEGKMKGFMTLQERKTFALGGEAATREFCLL